MKMFFWILLLAPLLGSAQSYNEKIALKACDCIQKDISKKDKRDVVENCIVTAKIKVDNQNYAVQKNNTTVESISVTFKEVSKLLEKDCSSFKSNQNKEN
ncbi:hypothetical protein [Wenyingzhuangia sp. IMCC45574]